MANDGRNGGAPHPGGPPLPHIDDITAPPRDIDSQQSMKRLLELCETSLRSAEMSREFKRPATALKDYLRAYFIAVPIVQSHRDYPSLQSSWGGELQRKHNSLLKTIKDLYDTYERIKADIRKDNQRSGVQPTHPRPSSTHVAGTGGQTSPGKQQPNGSLTNGVARPSVDGAVGKGKPIPHPKPQSLHGNAINGHARSSSSANMGNDMLASRLANLGGPRSSPGQDPRIKTHSFAAPAKPAGPREMPPNQKPKIGIDSSIPSLPKLPDAIYSPVRGSMSEESARLPSSTPRGPFSRTGSSTPISGSPSASNHPPSRDYFSAIHTNPITLEPHSLGKHSIDLASAVSSPKRSLDLSTKEVITAEELYHAMKDKGSVLIIDIRLREDFDEGHIMSSSTICIDPNILARQNLSADEIAESLVISPNQEQYLFEKRNEYDLVVLYDHDSQEIPRQPRSQEDLAIVSLHRALVHLSYGRDLKQPPRLLKGGLDAWVELMGPGSLQLTSASTSKTAQLRRGPVGRRKSKYRVTPMKADDVRAWQETVKNDDMETASSPTLYRTTEDFIRRYPAVPVEPEVMTSPALPLRSENKVGSQRPNKQNVVGDLPAPLARPAPAVSRPSHSGLSFGADDRGEYNDKGGVPVQTSGRTHKSTEPPLADFGHSYTGLNNPANWCYANSVLQSLLACEFGKELAQSDWRNRYAVPKRASEKLEQPQLMMQILSNLFHWMSTGKFEVMKASTLMGYSRHASIQTRSVEKFGDDNQHDAQEFMSFLVTHLDEETNTRRDRWGHPQQPTTSNQSLLEAAIEFWGSHSHYHQSIVDNYWRLIELGITKCLSCNTSTYNYRAVDMISPNIGDVDMSLERALAEHIQPNQLDDYRCDTCKEHRKATTWLAYPRMPSLLCVGFNRFGYAQDGATKSTARISWDLNDINMAPSFLRPDACGLTNDIDDKAFKGPFRYECFAVVEHTGSKPNSGHYTAYIRDPRTHDPSAWLYCDDSKVEKVRMDNSATEREKLFRHSNRVPYLAFFRRKFSS